MGGSGGSGGAGGAGGGPSIAPHTVLSGTPVTEASGCLLATGSPVQLLFDEVITGAFDFVVEGTMLPDPNGVGLEVASLVQAGAGCAFDGTNTSGCHLYRSDYNVANDEAGLSLYDTNSDLVGDQPFTAPAQTFDFTQQMTGDTLAGSGTLNFTAVPNVNATVGTNLFNVGGRGRVHAAHQ